VLVPTVTADRLSLVPLGVRCEGAYERFYTDKAASNTYGGPLSPAAAWTRLASDIGAWQLQGFGVWAIERKTDRDIVGVCGYWQGKGWPRELTWWLLPEARGQGLALEASVAAVRHAYNVFGWEQVQTYMNDANDLARALVIRLGGVKTDRRAFPDGLERDVFRIPKPAEA
jgi:[ribosomal protein S5]-alanine N-acetyltransferase